MNNSEFIPMLKTPLSLCSLEYIILFIVDNSYHSDPNQFEKDFLNVDKYSSIVSNLCYQYGYERVKNSLLLIGLLNKEKLA